jgi:hypothetical protein
MPYILIIYWILSFLLFCEFRLFKKCKWFFHEDFYDPGEPFYILIVVFGPVLIPISPLFILIAPFILVAKKANKIKKQEEATRENAWIANRIKQEEDWNKNWLRINKPRMYK